MYNEEAKTDKKKRVITEEELEQILDNMYEQREGWEVSDEEEAEAWFEEQFEKIRKTKLYYKFDPQKRPSIDD